MSGLYTRATLDASTLMKRLVPKMARGDLEQDIVRVRSDRRR
jgi:hypothetical protein